MDESIPEMPGWRWIHTPGHSPGHISLFRDSDRTLIAGDAFVTVKQESFIAVLTQAPKVHRPPAYFTPDWEAARRSLETLAELSPDVAATGHGIPMSGEPLRQGLTELLQHFDELIPDRGRYVGHPAIADEQGTVFVPPRVMMPGRSLLMSIGILALAGLALATTRKGRRRSIAENPVQSTTSWLKGLMRRG
jgi:hypothetical protein